MENFDELALTWDNEPRRIERAKTVATEIIKSISNLGQMVGFEYGCGTGLLSFTLQPYLKHITLGDNSLGMLDILKQKIQNANIENMTPFKVDLEVDKIPEIKIDLIYILMSLHHIKDIDKVIKAFYNMLNPQGYLCIADLDEEDGTFHGKDFLGHRGFNQSELSKKLESYGFNNVRSKICYENIKKLDNGQEKKYPLFLMIAQKE